CHRSGCRERRSGRTTSRSRWPRCCGSGARPPPPHRKFGPWARAGRRRGEVFALQWPDIDWGTGQDGGRIHVQRAIYQGVISTPKTRDSARVVDVPQSLLDELQVYRAMHPGDGYIFRTDRGRPYDPDGWHMDVLVPLLERAGLRLPGTGLHSLRHTYTSLLAAQGEDLRYVADQLGHSSPTLTQEIYQHTFNRARVAAMRRLDTAISSGIHPANQAETPGTRWASKNTSANKPIRCEHRGTPRKRKAIS